MPVMVSVRPDEFRPKGELISYPHAESWSIAAEGHLHLFEVIDGKKTQVASFPAGSFENVSAGTPADIQKPNSTVVSIEPE